MGLRIATLIFFFLASCLMQAQTVTVNSFDGISASQLARPMVDFDPNGAVGTKQYMEWVNVYYQGYDKTTFAPVWSAPQPGITPWQNSGMSNCYGISGDGLVLFDRLASRWLISARAQSNGNYYYCIAVSNTDDLTSSTLAWYTYSFFLNPILGTDSSGRVYFPDWPKFGTWPDAYYATMDLEDPGNKYQEIGVIVCALDRTNMLTGSAARTQQCFSNPDPIPTNGSLYLAHSLIPADFDGTTAPPSGRDEYLVSIENPPADGKTTTSNTINLWSFHVDWTTPANSTFKNVPVSVPQYTPGCYNLTQVANTVCVPEPSTRPGGGHYRVDSVGDRIMPRLEYWNFGTYESFLFSSAVQVSPSKQTGIRWIELRGSGIPAPHQSGTIRPDMTYFRFMPSIAQDKVGNAAAGYSVSSLTTHPGIRASYWNLVNLTAPTELVIQNGTGDEQNSSQWGDYTSMTVDPVDGCTFWYVNEYFVTNQTAPPDWYTRIANFKLPTCQ